MSTDLSSSALADRASRPGPALGVIVALSCVGQFMVTLDVAIVNVALPAMRAGLGMSANGQQWVVDGYLVTFGGFLLLAARAGDLVGRRRVFQAGLAIFTVASVVGGLATDEAMLLAARFVQGAGAAALAPATLSLITASDADARQRGRALALWSAAASVSVAVGLPLGGVLTAELSWRWVFFINLPIGIALLAAASAYLVPAAAAQRRHLDVPGALTATLGATALVYGISRATSDGWGSPAVVASLTVTAVAYAGFALIEMRTASPLVPLTIFRHRNLRLANLVMATLGIEMTSLAFFLSLYLQQTLRAAGRPLHRAVGCPHRRWGVRLPPPHRPYRRPVAADVGRAHHRGRLRVAFRPPGPARIPVARAGPDCPGRYRDRADDIPGPPPATSHRATPAWPRGWSP